jgi:hypothetical protein
MTLIGPEKIDESSSAYSRSYIAFKIQQRDRQRMCFRTQIQTVLGHMPRYTEVCDDKAVCLRAHLHRVVRKAERGSNSKLQILFEETDQTGEMLRDRHSNLGLVKSSATPRHPCGNHEDEGFGGMRVWYRAPEWPDAAHST